MYKLLVVVVTWGVIVLAKLPPYIQKCSITDPDINSCALNSARQALPEIIKGERKLKTPVLDPLFLPEVRAVNYNIEVFIINTTVVGWKSINLEKHGYDFEKKESTLQATVQNMNVTGKYRVSGKLATLPISGNGPFTCSVFNLTIHFKATYDLQKMDDGEVHMIYRDYDCDFIPQDIVCRLENMFNGNKLLGNAINNFLNQNWRFVYREVGKEFSLMAGEIVFTTLKEAAKAVPFKEMFNDVE